MVMKSQSLDKQQGFVALLFMLTFIAFIGFVGIRILDKPQEGEISDDIAYARLQQVRRAIIANVTTENSSLGMIQYMPDVRGEDNNYDGLAEAGCLYVGYVNGSSLENFVSRLDNLRCIGKFPWRSHGLNFGTISEGDVMGQIPWVMYSNNLIAPWNCMIHRTPLMLGEQYDSEPGVRCDLGTPNIPFKWITLYDRLGHLISDEIAVILVIPGRPMPGQTRTDISPLPALPVGTNEARAYLDRLQVTIANPAANPIIVNNWNQLVAQPRFIAGTPRFKGGDKEPGYVQPMAFNDRVLAISADELYGELEKFALAVMQKALAKHKQRYGYYPWAVALTTPNTLNNNDNDPDNQGEVNVTAGRLPFGAIYKVLTDASHPDTQDMALANQFDSLAFTGWLDYFFYAVAVGCTPITHCDGSTKLTVGQNTGINGILIGPGRSLNKTPINYPVSKGAAQKRITGLALSTDWRDYLDGATTDPANNKYEGINHPQTPNYNDKIYILP